MKSIGAICDDGACDGIEGGSKRTKLDDKTYWSTVSQPEYVTLELAAILKCKCGCMEHIEDHDIVKCRMMNAKRSRQERNAFAINCIQLAERNDEHGKKSYQFFSSDNCF
jgi:hypothetical protein